ncbi:DUF6879 family protein [Streptomyces sp. NPDC101393]|uniref:DUF6879 family protein n=1 Tax=Streptomyces sp. NPDC101393 TaxID=3366141 RepID=UPI003817B433
MWPTCGHCVRPLWSRPTRVLAAEARSLPAAAARPQLLRPAGGAPGSRQVVHSSSVNASLATAPQAARRFGPAVEDNDWWPFDGKPLAVGHFDDTGRVLGSEVIDDPEMVAECVACGVCAGSLLSGTPRTR